jgi:hypothetical protein
VNIAPVLGAIGNKAVNEMALLTFTATATDIDLPVQTLAFSLVGAPAGASITAAGVFTWTPSEAQGPGDYVLDVVVSDGSLTDSETISVHVNEVNMAPVLDPIGGKTVLVGSPLTFSATASDADIPVQTLTFSLVGAPAGASITAAGVFTWTPSASGDYTVDVVVSDGLLTDSETISVHVPILPTAAFAWTADGAILNVDASASGSEGGIASYSWNWGDGSAPTVSASPLASHTYGMLAPAPLAKHTISVDASAVIDAIPPPPYSCWGYVTDAAFGPIFGADVVITDLNTGTVWTGTTDYDYGYYMIDLNMYWESPTGVGWAKGDTIQVVVTQGDLSGTNSGIAGVAPNDAALQLDIVVSGSGPVAHDYVVTLTVTDLLGQTSTVAQTVTVYY